MFSAAGMESIRANSFLFIHSNIKVKSTFYAPYQAYIVPVRSYGLWCFLSHEHSSKGIETQNASGTLHFNKLSSNKQVCGEPNQSEKVTLVTAIFLRSRGNLIYLTVYMDTYYAFFSSTLSTAFKLELSTVVLILQTSWP